MTDTLANLKQQIQQLDELARSGALPADTAAAARAALERRLVDAVLSTEPAQLATAGPTAPAAGTPPPAGARPSPRLLVGLLAFVVIFGAAGYAWRGSSSGWASPQASATPQGGAAAAPGADAAASAPHSMNMSQIEGMVGSLAQRLKAQPNDADGWLMLGRSYAVLARFDEAIPAYRKVLVLRPKDAQAMADLADALAMKQARSFAGEPTTLIQAALAADPNNLKALSLAGTLAFEANDFTGALRHWERAAATGAADSNLVRQVRENIAEARAKAGLPPLPAGGRGVSGRVELAPALAAKVSPDDTVFIFARPATGARMPLAILKKRVRDLPVDFVLDDSLAMSPNAKLSSAGAVAVGARVSRSGQAMPQPGDLQGLTGSVALGSTDLRIVIADEVR